MLEALSFSKKPNQNVIELAEKLCRLAKEGGIDCLIAVWEGKEEEGRGVSWEVKGHCWHSQLIGALEAVKFSLLSALKDVSRIVP